VIRAVDHISFTINKGETLGLVGESGCGKTTTANLILRLIEPTSGSIIFEGNDISHEKENTLKEFRRKTGAVFQDSLASFDPRKNIMHVVSEPLVVHGWHDKQERTKRVLELLEQVGLRREDARKYPHQFSGGQRQRIGVARALALTPSLVVADEAVSALDVSVQAKIINLFLEIQKKFNLTFLFISHDLSVLRHISDKIIVMYLGRIVESGSVRDIFENPKHPYTNALLSAIPIPNATLMKRKVYYSLKGEVPSPINPPSGCGFRTRCPYAQAKCREIEPVLEETNGGHYVSCHYWNEISVP